MTKISRQALKLGGFLLAHATWIIADLGPGENYVPQALCLKNGKLVLNVFEADSQVEAVANGKAFMEKEAAQYDGCAFARDGVIRKGDKPVDVLTIDMAGESGSPFITLIQPYSKDSHLRLLGLEVFLTTNGDVVDQTATEALTPIVREGASSHSAALENWTKLNANRLPPTDLF